MVKQIKTLNTKMGNFQDKKDTMTKEFYQIHSEYNGLVAKKYRLLSKTKRDAQKKADLEKDNNASVISDLKQ